MMYHPNDECPELTGSHAIMMNMFQFDDTSLIFTSQPSLEKLFTLLLRQLFYEGKMANLVSPPINTKKQTHTPPIFTDLYTQYVSPYEDSPHTWFKQDTPSYNHLVSPHLIQQNLFTHTHLEQPIPNTHDQNQIYMIQQQKPLVHLPKEPQIEFHSRLLFPGTRLSIQTYHYLRPISTTSTLFARCSKM